MPHAQSTSPAESAFGPLVARGIAVWTAQADAWPLLDTEDDVAPVRLVDGVWVLAEGGNG